MSAAAAACAVPVGAVLFDLDGTLLDTAPDMVGSLNALRIEQGLPEMDYAHARGYVSHGSAGLVRIAFDDPPEARFETLRLRFLAIYRERLARATHLFPGNDALLQELERRALPWGVVTNKPDWLTQPLLEALGLRQRAACVVSGDTLPERKPHPAPLLHAARLIAREPAQCLYVGDAARDVEAARAAGMPVLVANFGYFSPEDVPARWPADGWVDAPQDILAWIESRRA
jgi:phosphoglycolate phosphatase